PAARPRPGRRQGRDPRTDHARGVGHQLVGFHEDARHAHFLAAPQARRRRRQPPLHHDRAGRRLPVRTRRLAPPPRPGETTRGLPERPRGRVRAVRGPTLEGALMRRRLLLSTLAVAAVAILMLGIPLAYAAHKLVHEEAARSLDREASAIAGGVGYDLQTGRPVSGEVIARERRVRPSGALAAAAGPPGGRRAPARRPRARQARPAGRRRPERPGARAPPAGAAPCRSACAACVRPAEGDALSAG